ncbi:MAG TPA: hypothetical protein VGP72_28815 [Planctomycetota bacterium]|jgi:hypothetical protein
MRVTPLLIVFVALALGPTIFGAEGRGLVVQDGATTIPVDQTIAEFKSDVRISNGEVSLSLAKRGTGAVLGVKADGEGARTSLIPLSASGVSATELVRAGLIENTKQAACCEAVYKTEKGEVAVKFKLKRGEPIVEVEPGAGAWGLRVQCESHFVVLPDFFADDMVIGAKKIPLPQIEIPSENFVLHLGGGGQTIAMCVFENNQQDVKVSLSGDGDKRVFTGSEIAFGEPAKEAPKDGKAPAGRKIWVAQLERPGLWHATDVKASDAGKVIPMEWQMPMAAQWRVDFTKGGDLTDSWEMLLPGKDGKFIKPGTVREDTLPADRKRWTTVLGTVPYPCWSDAGGKTFLQPVKRPEVLVFNGPVVIYPLGRVAQSPLDTCSAADVMLRTLGKGACEYVLDLEGQQGKYQGRATCSCRDTLRPIYEKKEQKQQRTKIEGVLNDGLTFVKHIRGRIELYMEFGRKMRAYLDEQQKAKPELKETTIEMLKLIDQMDQHYAKRKDAIKTPEFVAAMNDEFRKNVLEDEGPQAYEKCKKYTGDLVEIGGSQDELAGECRWVVKNLRQKAGLLMATDPKAAALAMEVRARTREALRNPANHEGARH